MTTFERVEYRDGGRIKTAVLKDPKIGLFMLSGTRVNGHGHVVESNRNEANIVIHLSRALIKRTPMRFNAAGTKLEQTEQ